MAESRLPVIVATAVAVPAAVVAGLLVFKAIVPEDEGDVLVQADLSPVSVEVPELSDAAASECLALTASVPQEVGGLEARPVEGAAGAAESVMAYGDPATVATCGVEAVAVEETAAVFVLNGVCWYSGDEGRDWVTLDRAVPVGVSVPEEVEQPVDVLNDLSVVIAEKLTVAEDAPTGCS